MIGRSSPCVRNSRCRAAAPSIRSEQSTQGSNSLDIWVGRVAMMGFAVAISVEIATGKGLLEVCLSVFHFYVWMSHYLSNNFVWMQNFGLTSPLPTVALAVTGLVGVLTAVFIYQSASKKWSSCRTQSSSSCIYLCSYLYRGFNSNSSLLCIIHFFFL